MKLKPVCSDCFAGLASRVRVDIVNLLKKNGKMGVMDVVKHFEVTQPTISHHLKYLRTVGVVNSKREGRNVYYKLNPRCKQEDCQLFI